MKLLKIFCLSLVMIFLISCEDHEKSATKTTKPQEKLIVQVGEVQRGNGLFQALKNVSIHDDALALHIVNALRDEVEFSKLKVGDKLEATFDQDNTLVAFSFSQNPAEKHTLKLNKETGLLEYSFVEEPTTWQTRMLEGELTVGSTLESNLIANGLPRSIVAEVLNVLLCKVNFRTDARMGDRYKVLLNEKIYNGSAIETQVLYTAYDGRRAGTSEAYYFIDDEKGSTYTAHYTSDGQALIRSGLRYPLSKLHIRSGYGFRRHPVTGRHSMHRGVDLRGRTGMPVHAVANGTVIESSYNEFAGNKVAIRHQDGSISYYLHLKNRNVRRGASVRSNQIIGSVGATGRVTGPHLHFGFKKPNGQWMNPMHKRMIATPKLQGERLKKLKEQIARTKGFLKSFELYKVNNLILADRPVMIDVEEKSWELLLSEIIPHPVHAGIAKTTSSL